MSNASDTERVEILNQNSQTKAVQSDDEEEDDQLDYSHLLADWKRPKDLVVNRSKESQPTSGSKYQAKALESSLSALVTIISEERRGFRYALD